MYLTPLPQHFVSLHATAGARGLRPRTSIPRADVSDVGVTDSYTADNIRHLSDRGWQCQGSQLRVHLASH